MLRAGGEKGPDVQTPATPEFPEAPETGDAEVDAALTRLVGRVQETLTEHVPAYEAVHRELQDRLADAEE
jgi:hypothetical protein